MGQYAFINGNVLSGKIDMSPEQATVLVDGDKITDIISSAITPAGYEIIDLKGSYLLPGLINMHAHLPGSGRPPKKQRDNTKLVNTIMSTHLSRAIVYRMLDGYARTELLSGVTTVRTVGGLRDYDSRLRDQYASKEKLGPRILTANEAVSVPHGHMAGSVAIAANSTEEAVAHVDKVIGQKADFIKLMITGGVMDAKAKGVPGELKMPVEMIKACCDEAHAKGYYVSAHVESPEGVRVALQNGVDSIEHGAKPDDEIIGLFKEKKAFLCTTISPALPYAMFDRSISHVSEVEQYNGNVVFNGIKDCSIAALKNDIPVALGNDVGCPYITQYDFWRELVYFHMYVGVSNQFALYSGTLHNAQLAGIGDLTGSIEKGKCADLIVTAHNPLLDLRTLRHVDMVMNRGNLIKYPKFTHLKEVEHELDKYIGEED